MTSLTTIINAPSSNRRFNFQLLVLTSTKYFKWAFLPGRTFTEFSALANIRPLAANYRSANRGT
jgi:hypothetical protein